MLNFSTSLEPRQYSTKPIRRLPIQPLLALLASTARRHAGGVGNAGDGIAEAKTPLVYFLMRLVVGNWSKFIR